VNLRWDGEKGGGINDDNITRGLGWVFGMKLLPRKN
jgi:hypothetical protein